MEHLISEWIYILGINDMRLETNITVEKSACRLLVTHTRLAQNWTTFFLQNNTEYKSRFWRLNLIVHYKLDTQGQSGHPYMTLSSQLNLDFQISRTLLRVQGRKGYMTLDLPPNHVAMKETNEVIIQEYTGEFYATYVQKRKKNLQ